MKRLGKLFIQGVITSLFLLTTPVFSQITIDDTDMPSPGDTLRISVTNSIAYDFTATGNDTTWDFSELFPVSQNLASYVNPASTPALYWFVFTPGVVTNLAMEGSQTMTVPGLQVTDPYTFYNKSTTAFKDLGFGVTIMGIPIPAKYDSPDICYTFPLNPSTAQWSSASAFAASMPGMGSYSTSRTRTSVVDGWGTVITPYGTFDAIRVKSHILQHDSIYLDTLGGGMPVDRDIMEYKWLAKGQGLPVIQATVDGPGTIVAYRDNFRPSVTPMTVDLGPDTNVCIGRTIELGVNITSGVPPFRFFWSTLDTTQSITVTISDTTTYFVTVIDAVNNFASGSKRVNAINCTGIGENGKSRLTVFPNPSSGRFFVSIAESTDYGNLRVTDSMGATVVDLNITGNPSGKVEVDLSSHPAGIYFLVFNGRKGTATGKLFLKNQR